MTKAEYLKQLDKRLKRLPAADYQEAMEYFEEYFEEIDEENIEAAIEELGTPKQAAAEIIGRMLADSEPAGGDKADGENVDGKKKRSAGRIAALTILGICAAPIGLPLIAAVLAVVIAMAAVGFSILVSGFAVGIALLAAGIMMVIRGLIAMTVSIGGGLMIAGMGLIIGAFSIGVFVAVIWCCKWIGRAIKALARKVTGRR